MSRPRRPQAMHTGTARDYRGALRPSGGETAFQVVVEQTDLWVVARKDLTREVAAWVTDLRGQLKAYMALDPAFGPSLAPVAVPAGAPEIVQAMSRAGAACGVGPMAAVAGTIARMVAERFVDESPDILVENGGDIAMFSTRPRTVGILADPAGGARLGVRIPAEDFPCALCASSARIGHSLSLGRGELAVARARDASLADAAATALCNRIRDARDLPDVAELARGFGLDGVFAQAEGRVAAWGRMELVAL